MVECGPDALQDAEDGLQEPLLPPTPQPRSPVPVQTPRCRSPFENGPQLEADAEAQAADAAELQQYQQCEQGQAAKVVTLQLPEQRRRPAISWKHLVQRPFLEVLGCTMPRVSGNSFILFFCTSLVNESNDLA